MASLELMRYLNGVLVLREHSVQKYAVHCITSWTPTDFNDALPETF